jgi:NSS family neurotransmitter:Na+ symporter
MADSKRVNFGSKLGVIAAAAGSAVGLGNIWRFPYELGESGGAAFLLVYLVCVLLLGVPVMMSEFVIGRMSGKNAAGAFRSLAKNRPQWQMVGFMGLFAAFLIMGFYVVVSGWTLEYVVQAVGNRFANHDAQSLNQVFTDFSVNTWRPIVWLVIFMAISCLIIVAGVKNGIEKCSKFMMPVLLLIIIALDIRSLTLPNGMDGLKFLFQPDFSKITSSVALSAMGQAFFSLSLGMGCMITYGSYINRKTNLATTVFQVSALDTLIAILAAIAIFPAAFSFGINPEQGPTLVFITLPNIFSSMPGGYIWAVLFFVLLSIAALTSAISLLETIVAYFVEERGVSRIKAAIGASALIALLGVFASLSLGAFAEFKIFGMTLFDALDNLTAKILMPVGAIFISLFVGWKLKKADLQRELSSNGKYKTAYFSVFLFLVRFVAPIAIFLVFLNQIKVW